MREITILQSINIEEPTDLAIAHAPQDDRLTRWYRAPVFKGSAPWTPPTRGCVASIRFSKADGHGGWYDVLEDGTPAVEISGNNVTMGLAAQVLSYPGKATIKVEWYEVGTGARISGFVWHIQVEESPNSNRKIVSTDYYNILSTQIDAVMTAAGNISGLDADIHVLPQGTEPTVEVTGGSGGTPFHLEFGWPPGPQGPKAIPSITSGYQAGTSNTIPPTGTWLPNPPVVSSGAYLWTKVDLLFSGDATPTTYYSVARQGRDGSGQVNSIDGVETVPGTTNIELNALRYVEQILSKAQQKQVRQNIGFEIRPGTKALLIGDSYNNGNGSVAGHGWGYYFLQETQVDATIIHQNGGGFAALGNENASYPNKTYAQIVDQLQASEDYRLIVAQAGWNDASPGRNPGGASAVKSGVQSFIEKAKAKWPDAEIVIAATNNDTVCNSAKIECLASITDTANENGIFRSTHNSYLWLQGTGTNASDNIHLNDDGYQLLGRLIANYVNGWDGDLNHSYSSGANCVAFPQGLKISWGQVTLDSNGKGSTTFPVEYVSAPNIFCYISGVSQSYIFDVRSGNQTATGCEFAGVRTTGSGISVASGYSVRWMAIGV